MKAKPQSVANQRAAKAKLEAYRRELLRVRVRTLIIAIFVVVATSFFVMLVAGDRFNNILAYLGLQGWSNAQTGVYADCSKPENRNVAYCSPRADRSEQNFKSATQGGPVFSLSGK